MQKGSKSEKEAILESQIKKKLEERKIHRPLLSKCIEWILGSVGNKGEIMDFGVGEPCTPVIA